MWIFLKISITNCIILHDYSGHATRTLIDDRVLTIYPHYQNALILFQSPSVFL